MEYEVQGIGDSVIQDYLEYGDYVNKFRHVPQLEDGLKPVYRRIILAGLDQPKDKRVKTAKVIGDNMAKYHPHGSQGVNAVVAELVHTGIFRGQGFFGSKGMFRWSDCVPAAERYTEVSVDPDWRELVDTLLPYVPHHINDLGNSEADYLPVPYPIGLQMGSYGIGVGLVINLPCLEPKSMVRAAYAALCGDRTPWKYLEGNYSLKISREDLELFWKSPSGVISYNFDTREAISGDSVGWVIEGDPYFVKPRMNQLLKYKEDNGKMIIRDESSNGIGKLFISKSKRVKNISREDIANMIQVAATVPKYFSIYTVYEEQVRPISGGVWLQKCLQNYNEIFKLYKKDQVDKLSTEISVWENFGKVSDKIMNTSLSYDTIAKRIGVTEEVVRKVAAMPVGTIRNTDPKKKIETLTDRRQYFSNLRTQDMLKKFLDRGE